MKDLNSKIKKYVAGTTAMLGVAAAASAQVTYVDMPDVELDGMLLDSFDIDINGDSITDVLITNNRTINTTGSNTNVASSAWSQNIMQAISGQAFLDINNGAFNGSSSSSYNVYQLDVGDDIAWGAFASYGNVLLGAANGTKTINNVGTGTVIGSNTNASTITDNIAGSSAYWVPPANDTLTSYIGFTFTASGTTYNGWVRVQVYDFMKVKIMDYAYDPCSPSTFVAGYKYGDNHCDLIDQGSSCADAYPVSCGDMMKGTTVGGIPYLGDCGLDTITTYATAWYSFIGDGAPINIDVRIRAGNNDNDWDPNLRIYEGDDCGNLTCIKGSEDAWAFNWPRVNLNTVEGKTYYAVVGSNGSSPAWADSTEGKFTITFEGGCNYYPLQEVVGECGEALVNGKTYFTDTTISVPMKDVQDSLIFDPQYNVNKYVNAKITINTPAVNTEVTKNELDLIATQDSATYQWLDCDDNNAPIAGETDENYTAIIDGNYAVQITDSNGCVDTSQCINILIEGLSELNSIGISVFPNPAENGINVSFEENQENVNIEIINILGEVIKSDFYQNTNYVNTPLDISTGMYIIRLTNSKGLNKSINFIKK